MDLSSQFLLTIGGLLLLGMLTSFLATRTFLPRVTLLLIFGAVIGKEVLDIIPRVFSDNFEIISDMALLMVGFLLGGKLTRESWKESGRQVLWISVVAALLTAVAVGLGLFWAGAPESVALLMGCIASATAPAAVYDVVAESGHKGKFINLLLSIVAIDDVWALLLFSAGMAVVASSGISGGTIPFIMVITREIGGAVLLGTFIGLPAASLTGRIKPGQPILTEALGIVFVCGGLSLWFNVSFLLSSMVMGMVIANLATHHDYPFHAIENIEWPFMAIFFVLAGASLEFGALKDLGLIGIAYILCRAAGKYFGAGIGSRISGADRATKTWMGLALFPQAGVPIGMTLVAANRFPEYRQMMLSIVISTTVFFEVFGPLFTRLAIRRVKRTRPDN